MPKGKIAKKALKGIGDGAKLSKVSKEIMENIPTRKSSETVASAIRNASKSANPKGVSDAIKNASKEANPEVIRPKKKSNAFAYDKNLNKYDEIKRAIKGGSPDERKAAEKILGVEGATTSDAKNWFQKKVDNPSFSEKMGAHKVPQKAAAGVGAAWMVSRMSDNKGQQSNAELYGQQTPYS